MRILLLTAGAAEMYCGSCLRDNALAGALKARGHDVVLAPVYTPTTTDEPNESEGRVLFGGVSVYLEQHVPLFRHTPAVLDRLWDATPVLRAAAKRQIKVDPAGLGEMTVSMLRGREGFQRKEIDKMLRWLTTESRFDVVNIPFALLIGLARPLRESLRVPIVCTLQGEDLFLNNLVEPWKTEALQLIRRAVRDVDLFAPVSGFYADFVSAYFGIPPGKLRVVPLGIKMDDYALRPPIASPPYTIGYFGRIAPEKGLHLLADAYIRLRQRRGVPETKLVAGGYRLNEHKPYFDSVTRKLLEAGLAQEFEYTGALDRAGKLALLRRMAVMSMPATYDEPKGLTLLEALATGVPIVQPDRGSFTEIVKRTGGGILVTPDDPDALADGLFRMITNRDAAEAMGRAGAEAVRRLYTADCMAAAAERVYQELIAP
jgi:glycosyltransferase involved in cell wall biosynthesis